MRDCIFYSYEHGIKTLKNNTFLSFALKKKKETETSNITTGITALTRTKEALSNCTFGGSKRSNIVLFFSLASKNAIQKKKNSISESPLRVLCSGFCQPNVLSFLPPIISLFPSTTCHFQPPKTFHATRSVATLCIYLILNIEIFINFNLILMRNGSTCYYQKWSR